MRPLGGAVQRVLRSFGIEAEVARADVVEAWADVAIKAFGPDAALTSAIRVEQDTLVVAVPGAQWASEIRLRERGLVDALRRAVPGATLAHIRSVTGVDRVAELPDGSPKRGDQQADA